ncbi:NCS2 family permease [Tunicatimonas pelagia]|uniref:NCS2 family permease n=1 Tax=Tunicatimonas pelagia TaxID=931531 RepID=UPI0026664386|nr:NCS2 family permease [Tunicatimonas pelagia]WKN44523.1 NCS2 family permease [Tunicatimonas pelagia]
MDLFKLRENQTTVRTEVVAGLTTFFTMAYIIFVNPSILQQAGMDFNGVLIATCVAAAVGTLMMALVANYPFAQAPGMGLNAFFAFTVVLQNGFTWQQGLAIVFISGVFFIILTVTGARSAIVRALPAAVRYAIPAGIGLFITLIGLNNAGIVRMNQGPIIDIILGAETLEVGALIEQIQQAPPQILEMGNLGSPSVLVACIGLIIIGILYALKVPGGILFSIILTTVVGLLFGITQLPESMSMADVSLSKTWFQLDFAGLFSTENRSLGQVIATLLVVIISFSMVDLFDTIGTLIGTADKAGFLDEKGNLPRMKRSLLADALATTFGALLGTSTVTTYIESNAGIVAGGRTGLTALVVAILFLLSIFLAPLAGMVPAAATAPALILVGMLMMQSIQKINFNNFDEALPAFLTMVLMPFTYSIANGIAAGIIFYVLIKVVKGKFSEIPIVLYLLAGLFVLKFVL